MMVATRRGVVSSPSVKFLLPQSTVMPLLSCYRPFVSVHKCDGTEPIVYVIRKYVNN
jgi:hypothetical protein